MDNYIIGGEYQLIQMAHYYEDNAEDVVDAIYDFNKEKTCLIYMTTYCLAYWRCLKDMIQ